MSSNSFAAFATVMLGIYVAIWLGIPGSPKLKWWLRLAFFPTSMILVFNCIIASSGGLDFWKSGADLNGAGCAMTTIVVAFCLFPVVAWQLRKGASTALSAVLARHSPEEHRRAEALAEKLLLDQQDPKKNPRWFWTAGKHALTTVAWIPYLVGSLYVGEVTIHHLRHEGYINFFTQHYSNFVEGIGFIGSFHHGVCAGAAACLGVLNLMAPRLQPAMEKYVRAVSQAAEKSKRKLNLAIPNHELIPLFLTATLFTATNAAFELNGSKKDWIDFYSGETGLVVAYMARNLLLRRLNDRANAKAQTISGDSDLHSAPKSQ